MTKIVLITSEVCQHCHDMLENVWYPKGGARDQCAKLGYDVVHERIPEGGKVLWASNHPAERDYVKWYPTILKFKSNVPEPIVYGAVKPGKNPAYDHKSEYEIRTIVAWVQK